MDEPLYSAREVAEIVGLQSSRVLYWAKTGVVGPSVQRGGKRLYNFQDLLGVRTARELLDKGVTLQAVRRCLTMLKTSLPAVDRPLTRLRVVSDGDRLVVVGEDVAFDPLSGQVVMDFTVAQLWSRVTEVLELPAGAVRSDAALQQDNAATPQSAYQWFQRACELDGDDVTDETILGLAADAYRQSLALDPHLAAAHTNLGHLEHRRGRRGEAREHFEKALALDPEQPEARYNLANLLDELGDRDRAILEWTRAVALSPGFADAHFNLGVALARREEVDAARAHLRRYLALDGAGEWAQRAEALLEDLV